VGPISHLPEVHMEGILIAQLHVDEASFHEHEK